MVRHQKGRLTAYFRGFREPKISYTPLNNYIGTPFGRLTRYLRATLPINQLKGKPLVAVCSILNVHRCKTRENRPKILEGRLESQWFYKYPN